MAPTKPTNKVEYYIAKVHIHDKKDVTLGLSYSEVPQPLAISISIILGDYSSLSPPSPLPGSYVGSGTFIENEDTSSLLYVSL